MSPDQDKRHRYRPQVALPIVWSDDMAYVVGLIATDGCLYTGFTKINFKSCDRELVETFIRLLGRSNPIKMQPTRTGGVVYFVEFGDAQFYRWLLSVGLMPAKSLVLGGIDVPDQFLAACIRGLFEGDGNLQNFTHKPTLATYPDYEYERLWTCFNSASRKHLEWIQQRVALAFGLAGRIDQQPRKQHRHDFFRLTYGNRESIVLLSVMYPSADVPMLKRKWAIWNDYKQRHRMN